MCRRRLSASALGTRFLHAAVFILAGAVPAEALAAQTSEEYRQRLAEVEREVKAARVALERAEETVITGSSDTLRNGFLTVITDGIASPDLLAGVIDAAEILRTHLRADTQLVHSLVYLPATRAHLLSRWTAPARATSRAINMSAPLPRRPTAEDVTRRVISVVEKALLLETDSVFQRWSSAAIPVTESAQAILRWTYVELAVAGSTIGRRCFAGEISACRIGLGIAAYADSITSWYNADERRSLIARTSPERRLADWNSCVNHLVDDACIRYLEERPGTLILPPISRTARIALARFALDSGGDSAYSRLVSSAHASVAERLAAASQLTSDSLMVAWHAAVTAATPEPTTFTPRLASTALAWVLVLLAAASRSTRWRSV